VRHTIDVDLVAQVASVADYYQTLHPKLKDCGFAEHPDIICRWKKGALIVDVMPSSDVFGHSVNRWYEEAVKNATTVTLPSGSQIMLVSAPLFIATKLDSFHGRGDGDYLHHDMEDILNVVDGREELLSEVKESSEEAQEYIRDEFDALLADEPFVDQLQWLFPSGRDQIVLTRLRTLAGI
jgi:predicted nucleotidyltransferase